jgi:hypothetical protein
MDFAKILITNWKYAVLGVFISVFSACDTEKVNPQNSISSSDDFFPISSSYEAVFEIYSVDYQAGKNDTLHYFVKEKVSSIENQTNQIKFYMLSDVSKTLNGVYSRDEIFSYTKSNLNLIENRESQSVIRQIYPLVLDKSFNINAFNSDKATFAKITKLNQSVAVEDFTGKKTFQNALQIEIKKEINAIDNIYKHQVYQKDIGLVYDLNQEINKQPGEKEIGYKIIKIRVL